MTGQTITFYTADADVLRIIRNVQNDSRFEGNLSLALRHIIRSYGHQNPRAAAETTAPAPAGHATPAGAQ